MKELENKIRKVLPRLQEVTKGCLLGYNGEDVDIEIVENYENNVTYIDCIGYRSPVTCSKEKFKELDQTIIGHRIQLNDVLEWALYFRMYSASDKPICEIIDLWNMEYNFLDKQGDRIIKILNTL